MVVGRFCSTSARRPSKIPRTTNHDEDDAHECERRRNLHDDDDDDNVRRPNATFFFLFLLIDAEADGRSARLNVGRPPEMRARHLSDFGRPGGRAGLVG